MVTYTLFWYLFDVFLQKVWVSIIFISLMKYQISTTQHNINQSETGIGDKKLSVEMCVRFHYTLHNLMIKEIYAV